MLRCTKIRLEVSEQDTATLEIMQGTCRGLYNWLIMRLRNGERWHFMEEKAALKDCRAYDPALDQVYGKLLAEVSIRVRPVAAVGTNKTCRYGNGRIAVGTVAG